MSDTIGVYTLEPTKYNAIKFMHGGGIQTVIDWVRERCDPTVLVEEHGMTQIRITQGKKTQYISFNSNRWIVIPQTGMRFPVIIDNEEFVSRYSRVAE